MKRFHVNVTVRDISGAVRFYSALFGAPPVVLKMDYAKWMLDDPRINFAISTRGERTGVNHLGIQVDSAEELTAMRAQLVRADNALIEQREVACCYANSDKYWVTDPAGTAWETFHTLGAIPIYGADTDAVSKTGGCCSPLKSAARAAVCCS
jgi:catechol 2,3-dioxygenase-like lactoylglutathione lyase family enzyme